jgi:DNA (cytosine-5)-methyltransferase 1
VTRPIAIDLFCGAGGMSLGFEQAGFDIALGVDRDAYHCAAHERNFPYGRTLCASVTDLTADRIYEAIGRESEIDVIFGGPPCQGFSMMGKRDLGDPRSSLVGEFVRIISEVRPKAFVMENVPGMQLGKTRVFFDYVVDSLSKAGYEVKLPAQTLVASKFGAPQKRERLFVIGIRSDLGRQPHYPDAPIPGQAFAQNVGEAFQGLPDVDSDFGLFERDYTQRPDVHSPLPLYSAVLAGVKTDPTDLSYPRVSPDSLVFGNKRTKHAESSTALYRATKPGEMVPGHKLPRLSLAGVSPTLRAGSESERGSHTAPRPIHPTSPRCITVREAARLHGYPDWFAFYPVVHHGFRQVGNSVSPFVARAVGYAVADTLGYSLAERRPNEKIRLSNEFPLIENRKKSERRISHIDEFPKVIDHLFLQRFDKQSGEVIDPHFTHAEIAEAIRATGANMPRIRPDSFLSEFARTRNAVRILATPLQHGYSIAISNEGGAFVPRSNRHAIGNSAYSSFSSGDIKEAVPVDFDQAQDPVTRAFELLRRPEVTSQIGTISRHSDLFEESVNQKQPITLRKRGRSSAGVFWRTSNGLIPHDSVKKLAAKHNARVAVASIALTQSHEGVVVFSVDDDAVQEAHKWVYVKA